SRLLTLWMDTAMNTLMSMSRTQDLRLWFLIDELGALHRLPALEKGLQTARNFGGAIVAGVHAYAKLKDTYGENMAMTLSSLARTKLILATADRETATWCSDFIGHRQVKDIEEGFSYGYNNVRDSVTLTPRRQVEPLLLPDQLMNLERLSGYIKFPDGFPAAKIALRYVDYPARADGFVPIQPAGSGPVGDDDAREDGGNASAASASNRNATGADDQGPGKPAERELKLVSSPSGTADHAKDAEPADTKTNLRAEPRSERNPRLEDDNHASSHRSKKTTPESRGKLPGDNADTENRSPSTLSEAATKDGRTDHTGEPERDDLTTREQRDAFVDRAEADDFIADFDLDL
ncbi:MAG: type IV secretion system DNA-binding domain-containing protein, partial [Pacificimonas sp.]